MRQHAAHRLTRRQALRLLGAAGAATFVGACSPSASGPAASSQGGVATGTTETPRSGGKLVAIMDRDLDHFDLHQISSSSVCRPLLLAYSGLLQYDPLNEDKIIPDLADQWDVTNNGRTYTFHIRPGVKFHDGAPLTSADVRVSLDRLRNPPKGVSSARQDWFDMVGAVEAPDSATITITLKYAASHFLGVLAMGFAAVYPKHVLDAQGDMKKQIVGTGPFKFREQRIGVSLDYVKNESYYLSGRPYLDAVTFVTIRDAATRYNVFKTGQAHLTAIGGAGLTKPQADELDRTMSDKVKVWHHADLAVDAVTMNTGRKPWDDVRIRRAVHLALDRVGFQQTVYGGAAFISGFVPTETWSIPRSELLALPGYRQPKDADRAEAKRLLADSGFPNGFETTVLTLATADDQRKATFLQDQLGTIGIRARLDIQEAGKFDEKQLVTHDYGVLFNGYGAQMADPSPTLSARFRTGALRNLSLLSSKEVDDLIVQQEQELDPAKRLATIRTLERKLLELLPEAPLGFGDTLTGMWKTVRGYAVHNGRWTYGTYRDAWLAE